VWVKFLIFKALIIVAARLGGCGTLINLSPTPYIVCIHILVGVVQ